MSPITSSVLAGFTFGADLEALDFIHSPPMKFWYVVIMDCFGKKLAIRFGRAANIIRR